MELHYFLCMQHFCCNYTLEVVPSENSEISGDINTFNLLLNRIKIDNEVIKETEIGVEIIIRNK